MSNFDIELVGKIGSMALIDKQHNEVDYNIIAKLSKELKPGYVWVTSGATEIGRIDFIKRNGYELARNDEMSKVDYAAQGQTILMNTYRQFVNPAFSIRQILVEHSHFNDEKRREHLKSVILRCPQQKAIPIINYNDPLTSEELVKMELLELRAKHNNLVECLDNDETASQLASLLRAKTLLIFTSVDGIYKDVNDPKTLISEIVDTNYSGLLEKIDNVRALCYGASRQGANGAKAKLEYIKKPLLNGTQVIIASPKYDLEDIIKGKAPRTLIKLK